jgi:hypothetical protein
MTEAANIPDADRRDRVLLALADLGKLAPSYGFVFNESRFDQAAFNDEAGVADLKALASDNLDHENNRREALVANTAKANGWAVVTREKRLRNRARALGIEVLSIDDLLAEIVSVPPCVQLSSASSGCLGWFWHRCMPR